MNLTKEQTDILNGKQGEVMAKVMETCVRYGELFGAEKMVPITSKYNHLVTSFGMKVMKPVYDLLGKILDSGEISKQKFSVDPRPYDPKVPANLLQKLIFKKFMYNLQDEYEDTLDRFGLMNKDAFTCTCYLSEVGNTPKYGDILSWAESSAVVYANSVLGARCNRNSGIIDLMGSILGFVPYFGLLKDEGRRATWHIEIKTTKKPEAQLLGSAIGMAVTDEVPYITGLNKWIGDELSDETCTYLKDFGAACASNGAVGLYHIDNLTPEAKKLGRGLIKDEHKTLIVDDELLESTYKNYPVIWKKKNAKPKLCFLGCPHMSLNQLQEWTEKITEGLKKNNKNKVSIKTVFTASPDVINEFKKSSDYYEKLKNAGVILSYICPLMYMNNPLCKSMPVITSSNKLRTYTTARYYTDEEILNILVGGTNGK